MTRETKIGLLVGLAFIVLFAILLSERSGDRPAVTSNDPPQPAPRDDEADRGDEFAVPNLMERQRDLMTPLPRRVTDVDTAGQGPVITPLHQRGTDESAGENDEASQSVTSVGPRRPEELPPAAPAAPPAILPPRPAEPQVEPPVRIDQPSRPSRPSSPLPLRPQRANPAQPREHVVVAGDTLGEIAQRYYGTMRGGAIDAIYQANRKILSSPNDIRVGQTLVIPDWSRDGGLADGATPGRTARTVDAGALEEAFVPVRARRDVAPAAASHTWHQVAKGETFSSIAEHYLGDARQWREVWKLNRAIFPDPDKLRHGVRIKVPLTASGTSRGRS